MVDGEVGRGDTRRHTSASLGQVHAELSVQLSLDSTIHINLDSRACNPSIITGNGAVFLARLVLLPLLPVVLALSKE